MVAFISRHRVGIGWLAGLIVLFLASPSPKSLALGAPIAAAGLLIRAVAAGTIRKGTQLARTGPYAVTRNPLYLGSSLLAVGFGIMSGSLLGSALLIIPSAAIYPVIIRREESELRRTYGNEFDAYREAVPCFLPRRVGSQLLRTFSFRQFMMNREYNAAIGFLAATGVLLGKFLLSS